MDKRFLIIIIIDIIIVFSFIIVLTLFLRYNNAIYLEKRIKKYSIKNSKPVNSMSLSMIIWNKYLKFVKKQRKIIKKELPTICKKYDKFVVDDNIDSSDYVTHKLVISLIFTILFVISLGLRGKIISLFQLLICIIFGFYILDIILYFVNRYNKKKIEEDILRAIIIMNSAFKAGKSTIQAVEIASKKLPNPIGYEFKKIYQEMKYGLDSDIVFDRFAKRVKVEEAEYLSSSLITLNKTGGNIISVFDALEKTLLDKKKLQEELKNSTMVSKLVVKFLLIIPIIYTLIIYILDPNYFNPFFESTFGYILLGIIILMFIIYAYLLDKIVKVEY